MKNIIKHNDKNIMKDFPNPIDRVIVYGLISVAKHKDDTDRNWKTGHGYIEVRKFCEFIGISKSAFYRHKKSLEQFVNFKRKKNEVRFSFKNFGRYVIQEEKKFKEGLTIDESNKIKEENGKYYQDMQEGKTPYHEKSNIPGHEDINDLLAEINALPSQYQYN